MLVLSLRQATSGRGLNGGKLRRYLWIREAMTVQMIMRGYDGNNGYAGYDGTKCNEEIQVVVNDTKGYNTCKSTRIKYDRYKRLRERT